MNLKSLLRMNFITLSGLIAGGMSNSPALMFAYEETCSERAGVAYSAVAPLAELTPIVLSQLLVVLVT